MKLINIKQKYKSSLRLWVLWGSVLGLGACAYDPNDIAESNSGEPQSRNLSDKLGSDLVISERVVIKSYPEKIRRLTILDGAVLATNGHPLSLDVEEIVSFNGRIDTTPVDPAPSLGSAGSSGGLFHLSAKRGRGNLLIVAGGQNGGEGVKGSVGARGAKGPRGNNGEAGYELDCLLRSPIIRLFRPDSPRCFKRWYCKRQTGNGGRGAQGARGKVGGIGGNGGNSAKVFVKIEDPSEINISTEVLVGKGGSGGQGGDGGRGGQGGDAGSRDRQKECRTASSGPEGPQGQQGPQGARGFDAEENPICLALGSARIGDCKNFEHFTQ